MTFCPQSGFWKCPKCFQAFPRPKVPSRWPKASVQRSTLWERESCSRPLKRKGAAVPWRLLRMVFFVLPLPLVHRQLRICWNLPQWKYPRVHICLFGTSSPSNGSATYNLWWSCWALLSLLGVGPGAPAPEPRGSPRRAGADEVTGTLRASLLTGWCAQLRKVGPRISCLWAPVTCFFLFLLGLQCVFFFKITRSSKHRTCNEHVRLASWRGNAL